MPKERIKKTLKEYIGKLKAGGYSTPWRKEVLESALRGYARMWDAERSQGKPINRPGIRTRLKRRSARLVGDQTWFKGHRGKKDLPGKPAKKRERNRKKIHNQEHLIPEGVLFVPHTPGGGIKEGTPENGG